MTGANHNVPEPPPGSEEQALCPNCLTPNDPKAHFCFECTTPLSAFACMDPIWSIWAAGDTYHKAAAKPTKPIVLIGMWLLFAIPLFQPNPYVWPAIPIKGFGYWTDFLANLSLLLSILALPVIYIAILIKTTRNYRRYVAQQRTEPDDLDSDNSD